MSQRARFWWTAHVLHHLKVTDLALHCRRHRLITLAYHGVTRRLAREDEHVVPVYTPVDTFAEQLRYLRKHANFVTLDDVLAGFEKGRRLPPRPVLVTFDDAYLNNVEYALPVLREFGIRAVVFVPSEPLDRPERELWYTRIRHVAGWTPRSHLDVPDQPGKLWPVATVAEVHDTTMRLIKATFRLSAEQRNAFISELEERNSPRPPQDVDHRQFFAHMTWEQLRELTSSALDVGGHTVTHPALSMIDADEARREIVQNFEDIRRHIGRPPRVFAYPFGGSEFFGVREEVMVREAGYVAAFAALPSWATGRPGRFAIPRTACSEQSMERFGIRVSGLLDWPLRVRDRWLAARQQATEM